MEVKFKEEIFKSKEEINRQDYIQYSEEVKRHFIMHSLRSIPMEKLLDSKMIVKFSIYDPFESEPYQWEKHEYNIMKDLMMRGVIMLEYVILFKYETR